MKKEQTRPIYKIAKEISKDWGNKVNYAAKPYLLAMMQCNNIDDDYGMDTAKQMVIYFLGNAQTWRGENARRIKIELNNLIK